MFGSIDKSVALIDFSNLDLGGFGKAFLYGGSILIIGMITVISVLCLLWLCLAIFRLCFHTIPEKRKSKKKAEPIAPVIQRSTETKKEDDGEIIAIIAAAIAMAESDNSGMKFRVVSFKRI